MYFEKTKIEGLVIIHPKVFEDMRGCFFESFVHKEFAKKIPNINFVQDNESHSKYGVARGLHFQTGQWTQSKLVRVVKGCAIDIAVDLRPNSPTFGHHYAIELSETNKKQFFIPRNFAHGFVSLSENTILQYKCDNYYNQESESGILFTDPSLNIDLKISINDLILNQRDLKWPTFEQYKISNSSA